MYMKWIRDAGLRLANVLPDFTEVIKQLRTNHVYYLRVAVVSSVVTAYHVDLRASWTSYIFTVISFTCYHSVVLWCR